ncbi:MAG: hypothetical protein H0V88_04865 [Pyrinomonadaceae bacterium]|nr:hypothetical protein [Pyrinomonadaceae bacterium]
MNEQYRNFAKKLDPTVNRLYEILRIEKSEDELKIVLGCSEDAAGYKCVYFRGVTNYNVETLSEEDTDNLPQTFNSFDYFVNSPSGEIYRWILLGDECEWSFSAPYPEVMDC